MNFPTREEFAGWLKEKSPQAIVGESCHLGRCPVARYLSEHGAPAPYVRPDEVARESCWKPDFADAEKRAPLPEWANEFAKLVDRDKGPVTAAEAVRLLAFVSNIS